MSLAASITRESSCLRSAAQGASRRMASTRRRLRPCLRDAVASRRVLRMRTGDRYRHLRCSQSHCSGCSRIQPSTMPVMICIVPWMSTLPSASRAGAISSVSSPQKELPSRLAHHAHAADRRAGVARKLRDQRVGLGPAAEEHDIDALHHVLVDQHADMLAAFQRVQQPHRRIEAGRDEIAHAARAHRHHGVGDRRRCSGGDRAGWSGRCSRRARAPALPSWRDAPRTRASACRSRGSRGSART